MSNVARHDFVSGKPDGSDATKVQATNWNRGIRFQNGVNGNLLLRDTSDDGAGGYGATWSTDLTWSAASGLAMATARTLVVGANTLISSDKLNAAHLLIAAQTVGDLLAASTTTAFARIAAVATGSVFASAGVGTLPAWSATPTLTSLTAAHFTATSYVEAGATPSTAGVLRVPNSGFLSSRNAADSANFDLLGLNVNDTVVIGSTGLEVRFLGTLIRIGGDSASYPALGVNGAELTARLADNTAHTGFRCSYIAPIGNGAGASAGQIRLDNGGQGIKFRNAADSGDLIALFSTSADELYLGGSGVTALYLGNPNAPVRPYGTGQDLGGSSGTKWRRGYFSSGVYAGLDSGVGATSGAIRLPNTEGVYVRNAANSGNVVLAWLDSSDIVQLGTDGARVNIDATSFTVRTPGPHAIGAAAVDLGVQLLVGGTFSVPAGYLGNSIRISPTINAAAGQSVHAFYCVPTVVEASSGTHPLITGAYFTNPSITGGAAAVTDTATVYIKDAMSATVTGVNYSLWVAAGRTRLGGDVQINGTVLGTTTFQTKIVLGGAMALGVTEADGFVLQNTTPALVGAQYQYAPQLRFSGQYWDTDDLVSRSVDWVLAAYGGADTTPTGEFDVIFVDPVTSTRSYPLSIRGTGDAYVGRNFFAAGSVRVGASSLVFWDGQAILKSIADGQLRLTESTEAAGVLFDVNTNGLLKLRTKADAGYATLDLLGLKASGAAGASFSGAITNLTVVNGIVTAAS